MKPMLRTLLIGLPVALMVGCASRPAPQAAVRLSIDPARCVREIGAMPVAPIPRFDEAPKRLQTLAFESLAGCIFAQDGNPLPLAVFALDGQVPTEIHLRFHMGAGVVFAAAGDLLDAEHRLLRSVPFAHFVRRAGAYTGSIFLNPEDAAARYLVLRPDDEAVGRSDQFIEGHSHQTVVSVVAASTLYYASVVTGSESVTRRWLSEVGSFSIWANTYQPPAMVRPKP